MKQPRFWSTATEQVIGPLGCSGQQADCGTEHPRSRESAQETRASARIGDELLIDHTVLNIDSSANEPPVRGGRQAATCVREFAKEPRAPTRTAQERHMNDMDVLSACVNLSGPSCEAIFFSGNLSH